MFKVMNESFMRETILFYHNYFYVKKKVWYTAHDKLSYCRYATINDNRTKDLMMMARATYYVDT